MSYSQTVSLVFTDAHARELASRVVADMHICSLHYGRPTESGVAKYKTELVLLLAKKYVDRYEFGFKKDGRRVVCWSYRVNRNGILMSSDRPGRIVSDAEITGAAFYNYLWLKDVWDLLSKEKQDAFEATLPFRRGSGPAPTDGNGYWIHDKNYCAGGADVSRSTFIPL